jgi:hypothetical protein
MKVKIKEFAVGMKVGSKGVGFGVADTKGKHVGDCYITMTGIEWCKGKTPQGNGKKWKWQKFIKRMK